MTQPPADLPRVPTPADAGVEAIHFDRLRALLSISSYWYNAIRHLDLDRMLLDVQRLERHRVPNHVERLSYAAQVRFLQDSRAYLGTIFELDKGDR